MTATVRGPGRTRARAASQAVVTTGAMPRLTTVATLTPAAATAMKYSA